MVASAALSADSNRFFLGAKIGIATVGFSFRHFRHFALSFSRQRPGIREMSYSGQSGG
jgi:hypothetical protein